jgi:hypothetical protein
MFDDKYTAQFTWSEGENTITATFQGEELSHWPTVLEKVAKVLEAAFGYSFEDKLQIWDSDAYPFKKNPKQLELFD